jgi:hypothetical protein
MSLINFQPQFDNAYEEVFNKVLVAPTIMNTRFEAKLKYGESVERYTYDISNVRVRSVTRGAASTIDTISDGTELLTVNLEKEAVFHISDGETTQSGPLNPGEEIGKQVAIKVATDLDARCFAEVRNALYAFDNGDLSGLSSSGTPITLTSTSVPQMITRMPAKLRRTNNQDANMNMCLVVDSYAAADLEQYLLSKNIDLAGSVFKNGYAGTVSNATLVVSENLTGEAILTTTGTFSNGETVVIGGVTFTARTALTPTAGEFLIGGSAATSLTNLAALINDPATTTANGVALSTANQIIIQDTLKLAATAATTTLTIVGTGSGRLTLSDTATNASWTENFINAYFGKKNAIDLVVQDMKKVDMRETDDRRGTNVFTSYLAGIKTFADGAKKFLDVKIAA